LTLAPALIVPNGAGPYVAFWGVIAVGMAMVGLTIVTFISLVDRMLRRRRPMARTVAAMLAFLAAIILLGPWLLERLGSGAIPFDGGWPALAGGTLIFCTAVLSSGPAERRASLVLAAGWVLVLGSIGYRAWTSMDVDVVWLGSTYDRGSQVAFIATRSADYELQFGAKTCGEGRRIASGRYDFIPDGTDSRVGTPMWIRLPSDLVPLKAGDVVRVCLRDGLAAATASGEFVGGVAGSSSFWPRP
jgi:hypothetical protein